MGLPINFIFTEPQTDAALQWGGSIVEPNNADDGFATIPLGLADERDDVAKIADSFDFTDTADGLAMEGVEVGIAVPGDLDLITNSDLADRPDTDYPEPDADFGLPAQLFSASIGDIIA